MPEVENIEIGSTQRFRPSKLKWFFVTLIGVLLGAGGVLMIADGKGATGWFVTGFFALVAGVGLLQLFGNSSYLELRKDGFTSRSMGRGFEERWENCSEFGVARVGHNDMVVFNRMRDEGKAMGKINKALSGGSAALPDTYGMKGPELAALMNAYREHALSKLSS